MVCYPPCQRPASFAPIGLAARRGVCYYPCERPRGLAVGRRSGQVSDLDWLRAKERRREARVAKALEAAEDLERRYYLDFPDVLSLEEFARRLGEERPFR